MPTLEKAFVNQGLASGLAGVEVREKAQAIKGLRGNAS
jgi:hypothetical protein